jgi:hypothetical protein
MQDTIESPPPGLLVRPGDWWKVPQRMRAEIWVHFRHGGENRPVERMTIGYLRAAAEALDWLYPACNRMNPYRDELNNREYGFVRRKG